MKKLSKEQVSRKSDLIAALEKQRGKLEDEIRVFNEAVAESFKKVESAKEEYNATLVRASELRDEIVSDQEGYFEDRSERWQESDAGQNYSSWKDSWQAVDLDEIEIEEPTPLDDPEMGHAEELGELTDEVEGS